VIGKLGHYPGWGMIVSPMISTALLVIKIGQSSCSNPMRLLSR
jgi:hypothetical protein